MATAKREPKPGTKAAERAAKRAEREAAIKVELKRRNAVVEQARAATRLPASFHTFDHTRVVAWKAAIQVLRGMLNSRLLQPGGGGPSASLAFRLQRQTELVSRVETMATSALGDVIQAKGKFP